MRRVLSSFLWAVGMFGLATHPAHATTITSSTFSDWSSSLSGSPSEVDFTQITPGDYSTSAGITLSGVTDPTLNVTFTGPDGAGWALTGTSLNGSMALMGGSDASAAMNVALPGSGENAVLISTASTGSTPIFVTLSDGEQFTLDNDGILGLSMSSAITSLTVSTTAGSQAIIDDFWVGSSSLSQDPTGSGVTSSPECATLLLISGGLLVLIGAVRRAAAPRTAPAA